MSTSAGIAAASVLHKLAPSSTAIAIHTARDIGLALYVHGAPGIGKSDLARQIADQLGIAFIDFRLSQIASEDLRGVPMLTDRHGIKGLTWTPPLTFPRDLDHVETITVHDGVARVYFYNPVGDNGIPHCAAPHIVVDADTGHHAQVYNIAHDRFDIRLADANGNLATGRVHVHITGKAKAILALDEFNSALPSVMTASYQLVLNRRLGDYIVPSGVSLLAMGNRDCDKGITSRLAPPVANRFVHIEMEVCFDDWLAWAVKNAIHPDVIGFLCKWRSKLFDFDPRQSHHGFATPRSWEFVSKIIGGNAPKEVTSAMICGAVGDVIGTEFLAHRKFMADMPDVEAILAGSLNSFTPVNKVAATQIAYSTAMQLMYSLKAENDALNRKFKGDRAAIKRSDERREWCNRADRAIGYLADHVQPEITIVALRFAVVTYRLPFSSTMMARFISLADEFNDLLDDPT